jgi:hypothetical protein
MSYKPSDFFVGVLDFFSVLLPGALLAYLGRDFADKHVFVAPLTAPRGPVEGWVAFAFASYLLGQFTFLVSATFMDDLYDHSYLKYRRRKADALFEKAKELQGSDKSLAGPLKWANAFVRMHSAPMGDILDQLEATSKFFRSVTVVLVIFAIVLLFWGRPGAALVCAVLVLFSFWRFANQRWKFTELTYLCFIQMSKSPAASDSVAPAGAKHSTMAGAAQ